MSRDPVGPDYDEPEGEPDPKGRIAPTGPGPLVVIGLVGLFVGWAVRGESIRAGTSTPGVSWLTVGVTWFIAAAVGGTAYLTWRVLHRADPRRAAGVRRLTPQQGLARLVLGKTVARLGALGLGGFLGSAISQLGVNGENADRLLLRALVAAVGAGCALAAGLLLEHACRVPPAAD